MLAGRRAALVARVPRARGRHARSRRVAEVPSGPARRAGRRLRRRHDRAADRVAAQRSSARSGRPQPGRGGPHRRLRRSSRTSSTRWSSWTRRGTPRWSPAAVRGWARNDGRRSSHTSVTRRQRSSPCAAREPDWPDEERRGWVAAKTDLDLDYVATGGGRPSTPWTEFVPRLRAPTLLVTGDRDVLVGPDSRAVVDGDRQPGGRGRRRSRRRPLRPAPADRGLPRARGPLAGGPAARLSQRVP